ncbi:type II toxin-antitoxin system PemK/MazF family toxin [Kribbella sp. CA-294648]|uniref:type II toxin-antitoxin system PemK/MazF family toxin n=1 Tax=Kribbella sp. CA-294648 TaxID=3239948 RepID=UPI003D8DC2E0
MTEVVRPEYAGDYEGRVHVEYTPHPDDGVADPGEIVWTWVPFEEDHNRGKDRPVLVVGSDGPFLLALILTSKDHDRDAADEKRWGRVWLDIGSGPWDKAGRASELRLDRVLRIDPAEVRREGAVIGEELFGQIAAGLHTLHPQ